MSIKLEQWMPIPDCVLENQGKFESMMKKKKKELEENEYLRAKGSLLWLNIELRQDHLLLVVHC